MRMWLGKILNQQAVLKLGGTIILEYNLINVNTYLEFFQTRTLDKEGIYDSGQHHEALQGEGCLHRTA